MLKIYKSMETGPLKELTLKSLEKGAWINIVAPTPYELKVVGNLTQVEPDFLRSALDNEERSHTDIEDNSIMILTNVPVMRTFESYDTLPLAIILTPDYIITVCLEDTPVISDFNERTYRSFRTFKKTRFLFQILYKSVTYYLKYLMKLKLDCVSPLKIERFYVYWNYKKHLLILMLLCVLMVQCLKNSCACALIIVCKIL